MARAEAHRMDEALRRSEERYRLLVQHAGIGIGYWDQAATLLLLNDVGAAQLMGLPEDFIGKRASEIFDPETAAHIEERIKAVSQSGETRQYEEQVVLRLEGNAFSPHTTGSWIPAARSGGNVIGSDGLLVRLARPTSDLLRDSLTQDWPSFSVVAGLK